jgi:hypothetical protein
MAELKETKAAKKEQPAQSELPKPLTLTEELTRLRAKTDQAVVDSHLQAALVTLGELRAQVLYATGAAGCADEQYELDSLLKAL